MSLKCEHEFIFLEWKNAWTKRYFCKNGCQSSFYVAYPNLKKKFEAFKPGKYVPEKIVKTKRKQGCCGCNKEFKGYFFIEPDINYFGRLFKLCDMCFNFYNPSARGEVNSFICEKCEKEFIIQNDKEWAKACYPCWKKGKEDSHRKFLVQTVAARLRKIHSKKDNKKLQEKRKKFIEKLICQNADLRTFEMYPCAEAPGGALKSNEGIPQYFKEYQHHNTRNKLKNETLFESDKIKDFDKAVELICSIGLILMKRKQAHSVFYAKGQRCPHIRIYGVRELEDLTPQQREKAQENFWRSVIPFFVHLADKGVWQDKHPLPLEFSVHWKYGTPYNLIYEYVPEVAK